MLWAYLLLYIIYMLLFGQIILSLELVVILNSSINKYMTKLACFHLKNPSNPDRILPVTSVNRRKAPVCLEFCSYRLEQTQCNASTLTPFLSSPLKKSCSSSMNASVLFLLVSPNTICRHNTELTD